nr:MAG TPA: hypothetical protein [Caudoviricetes sp.]
MQSFILFISLIKVPPISSILFKILKIIKQTVNIRV